MNARQRHERLQEMLLRARDLERDERSEFLAHTCGDDAELRRDIERLLAHDENPIPLVAEPFGAKDGRHALRAGLEAFLDDDQQAPADSTLLPHSIGKFRIRGKLGEGGMGTVYKAEQEHPHRTVALKVLRPASLSADSLRRFEQEGELLARLQHSGIAQIFDSGSAETEHGPQPYFAMELVRGVALTAFASSADLSVRARLELLARVADAVQHAHEQGVIHRDLKPANILVDSSGQPKVLDFGVARATDSDVQLTTLQTNVGQILGTLAYMSPEQASGDPRAIDTRSDVYSLGVLMFELLTGELPYDVSSKFLHEAVRAIQEDEPRRPTSVRADLDSDVETIACKALEKDKQRRYASAAALASDIRRFLGHEPIHARPASRLYTLGKFVRRNKTIVGAASMVFVSLLVGLIVSLRFGLKEAEQRRIAERDRYNSDVYRTLEEWKEGNLDGAMDRHERAPEHLRNWEWYYLERRRIKELAHILVEDVAQAAFLDETHIRAVDRFGGVHVWNVLEGESTNAPPSEPSVRAWPYGEQPLALSANAHWLLTYSDGLLALGDPRRVDPPTAIPFDCHVPVLGLRTADVSTDGTLIAVATEANEVIVFDLGGNSRTLPESDSSKVLSVSFLPDSRELAVRRDRLCLWDLEDLSLPKSVYIRLAVSAFLPDRRTYISESRSGLFHGDSMSGESDTHLLDRMEYTVNQVGNCHYLTTSLDGMHVALVFPGSTSFLELSAVLPTSSEEGIGAQFVGTLGYPWPVGSRWPVGIRADPRIAFSPSGTNAMSVGPTDYIIRLWQIPPAAGAHVCVGHESSVYSVAFSPDGTTIASGSLDGDVRLWDSASGEQIVRIPLSDTASGHYSQVRGVAISPDGKQIARALDGGLDVVGAVRGHVIKDLTGYNRVTLPRGAGLAYSTDGAFLVGDPHGRTRIWNARTLEELPLPEGEEVPIRPTVRAFAFDSRSTRLATGLSTGFVKLSDPSSGFEASHQEFDKGGGFPRANALAFAPQGKRRLVVGWGNSKLSIHDVPSLDKTRTLDNHKGKVYAVAFSPDGTRIASGGEDGFLRLWDAETGDLLLKLEGHTDYIKSLAFSPDGSQIATGSGDHTVRIWDAAPAAARWREVREAEQMKPSAERLVAELYAELGAPEAVVARLEKDADLDSLLLRLALREVLRREVAARSAEDD